MNEYTWHDVIKECEQVLGCEYPAESPLMCNLPNLIRDLQFKLEKAERYLKSRPSRAAKRSASEQTQGYIKVIKEAGKEMREPPPV